MSVDKIKRLLAVASSLKTRVLLSLGYGCGLWASEIVRLTVKRSTHPVAISNRRLLATQRLKCP
jgi:site-specific recombinase XerD